MRPRAQDHVRVIGRHVGGYPETLTQSSADSGTIHAVWISALPLGVTAAPGVRWYARRIATAGTGPETLPVDTSARLVISRTT